MKPGLPKHERLKAIRFAARLLAVAIMIGSLLSMLAPLGAASSTHLCTMECCIGKAPHLAGACSTGSLKTAKRAPMQPEVLCGIGQFAKTPQVEIKQFSIQPVEITPVSSDEEVASCGMHAGSGADSRSSEGISSNASGLFIRTLTSPCSADCCACSASNTASPRPREQAAVAWAGQPRPPSGSLSLSISFGQTRTIRGHFEQPSPRGPPLS